MYVRAGVEEREGGAEERDEAVHLCEDGLDKRGGRLEERG